MLSIDTSGTFSIRSSACFYAVSKVGGCDLAFGIISKDDIARFTNRT